MERHRPKPRLRRFLLWSLGLHLAGALVLLPARAPLSVEPTTEVDLVVLSDPRGAAVNTEHSPRPRADQAHRHQPRPRRSRPATINRPLARARRAPTRRRPTRPGKRAERPTTLPRSDSAPESGCNPLLHPRGCGEASARATRPPATPRRADRYASFRPRRAQPHQPRVTGRQTYRGLELLQHEDGGRLLRATGKRSRRPGLGELGLLTLASKRIGSRSGRQACDPYRGQARGAGRTLVLLVDTSGSVVRKGHAPASIVCAAGAALSALSRGYPVAVANFSSAVWYLRKSRDEDKIYRVLSRFQGEQTNMPPAALLRSSRPAGRDYVLVTDSAIQNLDQVLDGYARLFSRQPLSRALLFLLGSGEACVKCAKGATQGELCNNCEVTTTDQIRRLERAGFVADRLERHDDEAFHSFSLRTLLRGSPGAVLFNNTKP